MDVNEASGILTKGSGFFNSAVNWLSGVITWMFTFRNMIFILMVIGIGFLTYKLFENSVNKKRYYYGRNREV